MVYLNEMFEWQKHKCIFFILKLMNTFEMRCSFTFIFCHRTRWFHNHWRQSSTFLLMKNGPLYQTPGDEQESIHIITLIWSLIHLFFLRDTLTVDSPNTLIFFSWLLWSIFPPPRHLHSIPKASTAGLTFSNIWSVSHPNNNLKQFENLKLLEIAK